MPGLPKTSQLPNQAGLETFVSPPSAASLCLCPPSRPWPCCKPFPRLTGTAAAEADGSQPAPPSRIPLPQAQTAPVAAGQAAAAAGAHTALPGPMQLGGAERRHLLDWTATSGLVTGLRTRPACILSFLLLCQPGTSCPCIAALHLHDCMLLLQCKSGSLSAHNHDVLLSQFAQLGTTLPPLG